MLRKTTPPPEGPDSRASGFNEAGAAMLRKTWPGGRPSAGGGAASMRPEQRCSGKLCGGVLWIAAQFLASMRPEQRCSGKHLAVRCLGTAGCGLQ